MRIFTQIAKEVLNIVSYPFSSVIDQAFPNHIGSKTTILMVERWFLPNYHHKKWKAYLEKKGFDVHLISFPIYKGTFDDSAKLLKQYIELNDFDNLVIVGISAGGLTSLLYLEKYQGWDKIKKFISLGTPFYGSPMAFFTSFTKSGREMLPDSEFIKSLKNSNAKNLSKIYCLVASYDEMVPTRPLEGAKKITIDVVGHNNLHLDNEKTYETIAELAKED